MEYEITTFVEYLQRYFVTSYRFPYMSGKYLSSWGVLQDDEEKHHNRNPTHLNDAVAECFKRTTVNMGDKIVFDMGDEILERTHPYYHILENTPVIRKKSKGTKKTKGSQDEVTDVGKRDYEKVQWNGKTFTKEYSRNVRGARNRDKSVSHWITDSTGKDWFVNRDSNSYKNIHYHYIENALNDDVVESLALTFGMSTRRMKDTGLYEEYEMQLEAFESFD